jgi:hypothetical protein
MLLRDKTSSAKVLSDAFAVQEMYLKKANNSLLVEVAASLRNFYIVTTTLVE